MNFNRVIFGGRLSRDPQLTYTPSQTPVVQFGMAANRKWKAEGEDREEVCFLDCVAFGKLAEVINEHCQKGKALLVEGRLKYETWEDKQSNGKRSKHVLVVENFQFIGGPGEGNTGGTGQRPPAKPASKPESQPPDQNGHQFKEDDIPF